LTTMVGPQDIMLARPAAQEMSLNSWSKVDLRSCLLNEILVGILGDVVAFVGVRAFYSTCLLRHPLFWIMSVNHKLP